MKREPLQAIEIGVPKISSLSKVGRKELYRGLLRDIKKFIKEPQTLAEYGEWRKQKKRNRKRPERSKRFLIEYSIPTNNISNF